MLSRAVLVVVLTWGQPGAAQNGEGYAGEEAEVVQPVEQPPPKPKPAPVLTLAAKKALASFCAQAANRNDARCRALQIPPAVPLTD
jgi:hypothetical protein